MSAPDSDSLISFNWWRSFYDKKNYAFNVNTYELMEIDSETSDKLNKKAGGYGGKMWGKWYFFFRKSNGFFLKLDGRLFTLSTPGIRIKWTGDGFVKVFELWAGEKILFKKKYVVFGRENDILRKLAHDVTGDSVRDAIS